ncbi:mitochondrial thiamine pyrophosphate transporter [Kickxella alabastrina]|uniref:Mitochondrial thiamine pyrophosphate transporter n=1 Tax=Kickxella alabastrina TaxID=61397 RepID=A0ACC1IDI9_9FUNG|nr:mitochondrial thiamine pyrophosphate transporter [Kickxella alabastrina]
MSSTTPIPTTISAQTTTPKPPSDNPLLKTTRSNSTRPLTSLENAFCGATAGLIARAVVSPFDVIKITLQLETQKRTYGILRPTSTGVLVCASRILKKEGVRGFFKGNLSAEYLYLTYGASQFLIFGTIERMLGRVDGMHKSVRSFVGGAMAGAIATSVTYPFDLLRTRFVAQEASHKVHTSIIGAVRQISREEGIRGFYRGLWPACLQIMPYMGIVFTSYDALGSGYRWMRRSLFVSQSGVFRTLDSVQDALIGGGAAVIGKCCVYPLDLVRKRLQVQGPHLKNYANGNVPRYTGMSNALAYIVRHEGFLALFRGLTPALIKAAPASATVFYIYGQTRDLVLTLKPE